MQGDVRVPPFRSESDSEDWRQHLFNQERMVAGQEELTAVLQKLLEQQQRLGQVAEKLDTHLSLVSQAMEQTSKATSGLVAGVIKVPIAMAVVGAASWAFMYAKEITETTWLIIMGVAVFPWLGESITAVAKLVRGRSGDGK